jgi:hypothetical protein
MIRLTVQRDTFTENSTTGEMLVDGAFFCYTLEPRSDQSGGKPYCIPAGTYSVTLSYSTHNAMVVPHVNDVPGFTEIEIHPGNFPSDTEGCCLVGETRGVDVLGSSRIVFESLMVKLQTDDEITVTYIGGANAIPIQTPE